MVMNHLKYVKKSLARM